MTRSGHRHHGLYNSCVYAFRQHISHSKLAYPVMACGQNKPQGRFNSYAYVFRRYAGYSKLAYPVMACDQNKPNDRFSWYVFVFAPYVPLQDNTFLYSMWQVFD